MNTNDVIENGRKKVEELLKDIKKLEQSEAIIDVLEEPEATLCIRTKGCSEEDAYLKLDFISSNRMEKLIAELKKELRAIVADSKTRVEGILCPNPEVVVSKEPVPTVIVEEKKPFVNEDFEAAVNKMIEGDKKKAEEKRKIIEKPTVAPVQLPGRFLSKDAISDKDLKQMYFKDGLSVKTIAERVGIKPDSLYKRIQAMKEQQADNAKECVRLEQK